MPTCCAALRAAMSDADTVTYAPPKGTGLRGGIHRRPPAQRFILAQVPLGHATIETTVRYLGVDVDDALSLAEQIDL